MITRLWSFFKQLIQRFNEDRCLHLAAALSYYTIFSLGPFLVLVISVTGLFYDNDEVARTLYREISGLVGPTGAEMIEHLVLNAHQPKENWIATAIGSLLLFLGATSIFIQIQHSLNIIWRVKLKPKKGFVHKIIADRLQAFGLILSIGFLFLVSLFLNALLAGLGPLLFLIPTTTLFALMFKILPDATIRWRDAFIGGFVTAILFSIGQTAIGIYLGQSHFTTTYGAAAVIVVIMVWIHYSSVILFAGAEFTALYTELYGKAITPSHQAVRVKHIEKEV